MLVLPAQIGGGEARHLVSYGYYRAFNTMLDNINVLHDLAMSTASGRRFKEIKKGTVQGRTDVGALLSLLLLSSKSTFSQPSKEKMHKYKVVRICIKIIFHLSKL